MLSRVDSFFFQTNSYNSFPSETPFFEDVGVLEALDRDHEVVRVPYILTNEENLQATYTRLLEAPQTVRPFHIGFSGWFNFDIIVHRKSIGGIVADISNSVLDFYKIQLQVILKAETPDDFVELLLKELKGQEEKYFHGRPGVSEESIRAELKRDGSWLATQEGYTYIRSLYQKERIFHFRLDISDVRSLNVIGDWMRRSKVTLDTYYVSNIADWLVMMPTNTPVRKMYGAARSILGRDSLVIDSSEHFGIVNNFGSLPQKVFSGPEYDPRLVRQ